MLKDNITNYYYYYLFLYQIDMATVEITAYRGSSRHGDITSIIDGRNKRLKIGKTMRRTTAPIPVLPPRIPTPMPKPPNERYDVVCQICYHVTE